MNQYRYKGMSSGIGQVVVLSLVIVVVLVGFLGLQSPVTTTPMVVSSGSTDAVPVESLFMYCAAGIRKPVAEVAAAYAKESFGVPVELQYGGSNTLLSQLEVAGIGDVYLAADEFYIEKAREKKLVKEAVPISWMGPVLAVKKGNPKNIKSADDLLKPGLRIGAGNPDQAAVGRKTRKLLTKSGHWDGVKTAIETNGVFKPTVNEVANDVKIGSIDVAIIWDSTVAQYDDLEAVRIPELEAGRSKVMVSVMASAKSPTLALQFCRYLGAKDKGLPVFKKYGFDIVEGDAWARVPEITVFSGGVNRVAVEDTIKEFEAREQVKINTVYNGCGILVAQMKGIQSGSLNTMFPGAYFACDISFMEAVQDDFLPAINLTNTDMVIITPPDNPNQIKTLNDLTNSGLKVGVANPDESALGDLTRKLLQSMALYDQVEANVATKTPTADLLVHEVRVKALDAAIVYRANTIKAAEHLNVVDIDHELAQATQPYAVAKNSDHRHTLERLMEAIQSANSQDRYTSSGFNWLPESDKSDQSSNPSTVAK